MCHTFLRSICLTGYLDFGTIWENWILETIFRFNSGVTKKIECTFTIVIYNRVFSFRFWKNWKLFWLIFFFAGATVTSVTAASAAGTAATSLQALRLPVLLALHWQELLVRTLRVRRRILGVLELKTIVVITSSKHNMYLWLENTHLLCKGSIAVFAYVKLDRDLQVWSNPKQSKKEVSHTVILPLMK